MNTSHQHLAHDLRSRPALSLFEVLAVVLILGIIAVLIVPRIASTTDNARENSCLHNCSEIDISVERYYVRNGVWPANDLSDISADPDYFPGGVSVCPVSGAAYRLDPTTHRVVGHAGPGGHTP